MRDLNDGVLIASHNIKKKKELERILAPLGIPVFTAQEKGIELTEAEETGLTFEENALIKARSGCEETGYVCVGDDSGLCVDYLGGAPGVYSARYAGEHGNDAANIKKLLAALDGVGQAERTARFVSCAACVFPDGTELTARGECEGFIGFEPVGDGGFGYDPVFMYEGKSFAVLSAGEKDAVSHRGKSLRAIYELLKNRN